METVIAGIVLVGFLVLFATMAILPMAIEQSARAERTAPAPVVPLPVQRPPASETTDRPAA